MNSDKTFAGALLLLLGAISFLFLGWLYGIFAYGFVIIKLWAWFVVPVFHPEVTFGIMQASGLFMFIRFITIDHKMPVTNPDEELKDKIGRVMLPILLPWAALFFGRLLHTLMY